MAQVVPLLDLEFFKEIVGNFLFVGQCSAWPEDFDRAAEEECFGVVNLLLKLLLCNRLFNRKDVHSILFLGQATLLFLVPLLEGLARLLY